MQNINNAKQHKRQRTGIICNYGVAVAEMRARQGKRGKLEGAYINVRNRKLPQFDAVSRRIYATGVSL